MKQPNCKFAETCGGGHTTAQHYLHVYERVIRENCGSDAYLEISAAVEAHGVLKEKK